MHNSSQDSTIQVEDLRQCLSAKFVVFSATLAIAILAASKWCSNCPRAAQTKASSVKTMLLMAQATLNLSETSHWSPTWSPVAKPQRELQKNQKSMAIVWQRASKLVIKVTAKWHCCILKDV
jgi:hypothetical protein